MAARTESKKHLLSSWIEQRRPALIDEAIWMELQTRLAPVSESYLRKLIRECGLPMTPLVEGVSQDSLESLERTLSDLAREYSAGGDKAKLSRARVIEAKDHARWALRRAKADEERRALKEETILWMMTWLENPRLFESWAALRKPIAARSIAR